MPRGSTDASQEEQERIEMVLLTAKINGTVAVIPVEVSCQCGSGGMVVWGRAYWRVYFGSMYRYYFYK